MISGFQASRFREKMDEKAMKERSRNGSGFWHRFFIDLGSIWGGFWEAKSIKKRSKKHRKNDLEKTEAQGGQGRQ